MIQKLWALDDGLKIRKTDVDHPFENDPNNKVWANNQINIFGGKNEIVSFQLILQGDGSLTTDVDVEMSALTNGTAAIGNISVDPTSYVGRNIEIFLQHYYYIEGRSHYTNPGAGGVGTNGAKPVPDEDWQGWMPDALVPIEAPSGPKEHGQGGAPFTVDANMNQGLWVDVYVPKDAVPGIYTGTIRVHTTTQNFPIPIVLKIYNFTLPDETHLSTFFHHNPYALERFPGVTKDSPEYWDLFHKYMNMFHRHRMDLIDGARTVNEMEPMKHYFTGDYFTNAWGYSGPGENVGLKTYSIGTYDQGGSEGQPNRGWVSGFWPHTEEGWRKASDEWETWFNTYAPNVVRFKYMIDEPDRDRSQNEEIRTANRWIHNNPGVGKSLPTFCTMWLDPDIVNSGDDAVDFYSPGGEAGLYWGYHWSETPTPPYPTVQEIRAQGKRVAIYNGYRPSYAIFGVGDLDAPVTDPRVIPLICHKYDCDLYFLWETQFWADSKYGGDGQPINPWEKQTNAVSPPMPGGDGIVCFAGRDTLYTNDDRGVDMPIASMRMKNFRRGMQDVEYVWLAEQKGVLTNQLNRFVPAAFDDYESDPNYTGQDQQPVYPQVGWKYELIREELAGFLEESYEPPIEPPEEDEYQKGYDDGYATGHDDGSTEGHETGYDEGYTVGYDDGFRDGYDIGHTDGYELGKSECSGSASGSCECDNTEVLEAVREVQITVDEINGTMIKKDIPHVVSAPILAKMRVVD